MTSFLKKYDQFKELASIYESVTVRNQQVVRDGFSLYEEVDCFFNFLYHDHPDKLSKEYTKVVRLLSRRQVKQEMHRYFKPMSYAPGSGQWRLDRSALIRKILPFKAGSSPRKQEIKKVLDCLHCLPIQLFIE